MAETESQQVSAGLPAALTQAVVPLAYDSLQADLQKQQPPEEVPGSGGVQLQEVPFQAWPQDRTYQQPALVVGVSPQQGPVQYIAVSDCRQVIRNCGHGLFQKMGVPRNLLFYPKYLLHPQ